MTIRSRLFLGFGVLVAIFIVDYVINFRLSNEVNLNSTYLTNSETIIRNSNLLHRHMIAMQGSMRGYLLTGQIGFLEPYNHGLKSIPAVYTEQRALLSSSMQITRLDSIMQQHKIWEKYASDIINARLDTLPEARQKYDNLFNSKLRMEVGKRINDDISDRFNEFDAYEYRVRAERRRNLTESVEDTRRVSQWLAGASVALAVVLAFYITRLITRRINKMVTLAEDIAGGRFRRIQDDSHDELRKLSESLSYMSETLDRNFRELTRKNKELDQFAYVVSHDLKAPLRGISNVLNWLAEDHSGQLTPEIEKYISLIRGRTERLENMINGLLAYARIGKEEKSVEPVNVNELLGEIVSIIVPPTFKVSIEGEMPVMYTEKLRLEQVFTNLISNAVKHHNRPDGHITISCTILKDHCRFAVSDDGPGIDPQYQEKVFKIFQTLKERDAFESTGVGLAIVKKIIEEHKSTIQLSSKPGKGSTFTFTWPYNPVAGNK